MKKNNLLCLALLSILFLNSCGGDMDNWPYCDLPNYVVDCDSIIIERTQKNYNSDFIIENDKYYSDSREVVLNFYSLIENMHVSPEISDQTLDKYCQKISIIFEGDDLSYTFEYYELSMKDGYFVFNFKETHEFKGDFYGAVADSISKNSDKLTKL